MSQPVIIKNKIVYGYTDKTTVCRDMGRTDYNNLTEAQQLNGDVCFIQGVDASAFAPTNSLWNKVGTTPLDSELPADCSNAINQLKSDLTELQVYSTTEKVIGTWIDGNPIYRKSYSGNCWSNATNYIDTISNIDILISAIGSATSNYNWRWAIPSGMSDNYSSNVRVDTANKRIGIFFGSNYRTSDTYILTIEYTKTTD